MKKWILIMVFLMLFPSNVFASFQPSPGNAYLAAYYNSWKDEYRAVYSKYVGVSYDTVRVYFETSNGVPYQREYPGSVMVNASAYWLTCNGQYQFQYLSGGQIVAWSEVVATTAIQNPPCVSYGNGGSSNDANANYTPNQDGSYKLNWTDIPGSNYYEVWKDGQLIATVPSNPGGQYSTNIPAPGGGISIVGKDQNGNYTGHSDINVPDNLYEDGGENGCNVCQKLRDLLACPEWDTYMGELTRAIKNALPTLPEWRQIADQFVDAFADYFGPVPAAPTKSEIASNILPDMPMLDTSFPEANVAPAVPSEFNQPLVFDITTGPEIPVVDESVPFEIYEPTEFIQSDSPGEFVYPGDSRNSSNGIKNPDRLQTPYPQPVPEKTEPGGGSDTPPIPAIPEDPEIPPSDIPIPAGSTGIIPIPSLVIP